MTLQYAAMFLVVLGVSAQVSAQQAHCDTTGGKAVTSLDQLPAQVQDLLGRDKTGTEGIAEIGGKFNSSDAIVDASVPMRRLAGGAAGPQCIWLTVEYGGNGRYQKKLEYWLADDRWTQLQGANAARAPAAPPASMPTASHPQVRGR